MLGTPKHPALHPLPEEQLSRVAHGPVAANHVSWRWLQSGSEEPCAHVSRWDLCRASDSFPTLWSPYLSSFVMPYRQIIHKLKTKAYHLRSLRSKATCLELPVYPFHLSAPSPSNVCVYFFFNIISSAEPFKWRNHSEVVLKSFVAPHWQCDPSVPQFSHL